MWVVATPTSAGRQPTLTHATIWQPPKDLWVALVLSVLHQRDRTSARRILRPTYFLHFGRVGWSRHQVGRFSTHMVRLAAQPARRLLLDRQWAGMRWLSNAHSSTCHSVWHTPGSLSCAGRCLATGCDSQPARSTAARAALASSHSCQQRPPSSPAPHYQHHHFTTSTSRRRQRVDHRTKPFRQGSLVGQPDQPTVPSGPDPRTYTGGRIISHTSASTVGWVTMTNQLSRFGRSLRPTNDAVP